MAIKLLCTSVQSTAFSFLIAGIFFLFTCDQHPVQCIETGNQTSGRVNGTPASIGGYNVYYGSLHNHCNVDDNGHATGTPSEAYNYAKNTANLDFFGLSSHDIYISESEWSAIGAAADAATVNGVFVGFRGFEWTTTPLGHIAIVNSSDCCKSTDATANTFPKICSWIAARAGAGCIAFFNHPGRQNGTGVEFNHFTGTPPVNNIIGMELWNKSDPFSDYYYNDGYYTNDNNKGYFDEALSRGWKIGAAGAGDDHTATWGTAQPYRLAILAENLTKADLLAAMQARRFFSTLDASLALSFKFGAGEMGSTLNDGTYTVGILAGDVDNEIFTQVIMYNSNHSIVETWTPSAASVSINRQLTVHDTNYYYVKVTQQDGDEAISSPIWITNTPPTCAITEPPAGAIFEAPASMRLSATATDLSGTIGPVMFFANSDLIGEATTSPYSILWKNVPAGSYAITATATDLGGKSTTSSPVAITVNQPACMLTVDKRVAVENDDAEENRSSGLVGTTSTDLELIRDGTDDQIVGIRFAGCSIPRRSLILNAWIQFTCDETSSGATTDTIRGENADNSAAFVDASTRTISSRSQTTAFVPWIIPAWNTINQSGAPQKTPALTTVVQQIVDLAGFSTSSAITFLMSGTGSRTAHSFYGGTAKAPRLHIEYCPYVNQSPVAAISSTPTSGTAPITVSFDANASSDPDGDALTYTWNFGDGTTGAGVTAAHVYTAAGSYTATLTLSDGNGGTDIETATITVTLPPQPPIASFSATPTSGIAPLTVSFDAAASTDPNGDALTFAWNFGDGTSGAGVTVSHVYTAAGSYTATLTVSDGNGGTDNETATITVTPQSQLPPTASFTATPLSGTAPLSVAFNAAASTDPDGDALTFAWNFGDGTSGSGVTTSHVYVSAGPYTATLTVSDGNGGTDIETANITVASQSQLPPTASFTATPTNGTAPLTVSFDAATSSDPNGDALTFEWNFGDGTSGAGVTTSHVYVTAGPYTATLTVSDGNGGTDIETANITVTLPQLPPVASFTATPTSGTAPLSVAFNAAASSDPNGDALTFAWNFGDGTSGSGVTTSHVYVTAGPYTATLTVNDGNGGTDNETTTISVTLPPLPPIASFTANPTGGSAPLTVSVNATASTDPNGDALTFAWNFGDGSSGAGVTASHVYTAAGSYTVTLTVNDGNGGTDDVSKIITVSTPQLLPVAAFTATPTSGSAPLTVSFNAGASTNPNPDALTCTWNFGDGSSGIGVTISHIYTTTGPYTVTLMVSDGSGNSDNETATINVTQPQLPPTAAFTATPNGGTAPLTVSFDAAASSDPNGDALTFAWNFGDGSSGSGITVSHAYTAVGSPTVTLTVNDGNGGTDNETVTISVTQPQLPPKAAFTATPNSGTTPLTVSFDAAASSDPNGDALTFAWNFGDGTSGSGVTTSHVYTAVGSPTVTLSVNDGNGNFDNESATISVTLPQLPPVASFTATPTSGTAPLTVSFDAATSNDPNGDALTFAWNFGDGSSGSGVTVLHAYTAVGSPTVTLTVSDGSSGSDNESTTISVTLPQLPPVASFTATPTSGTVPLAVSFDAAASSDPNADPLTYAWNFGDGTSGAGVTVSHIFTTAGSYTTTLTVSDNNNGTTTKTISITADHLTSINNYRRNFDAPGDKHSYQTTHPEISTSLSLHTRTSSTQNSVERPRVTAAPSSAPVNKDSAASTTSSCSVLSPKTNSIFTSTSTIQIIGSVLPSGKAVRRVDFLIDGSKIGEDHFAPFLARTENLPIGPHNITLIALLIDGKTVTSSTVPVFVKHDRNSRLLRARIAAGPDDVEMIGPDLAATDNSYLGLARVNKRSVVGLRFTDVDIPPGAIINHACLQFTSSGSGNKLPATAVIRGAPGGNSCRSTASATLAIASNITGASVSWAILPWKNRGDAGTSQRTPELKNIVQEIISHRNYNPATPIVLTITGTGSRRAVSFENSPEMAAFLMVDYSINEPLVQSHDTGKSGVIPNMLTSNNGNHGAGPVFSEETMDLITDIENPTVRP